MTDDGHPFFRLIRSRLNSGALVLVILVVIEVLTNLLSENLTVGRLSPNDQLVPNRAFYGIWVGLIICASRFF